MGCAPKTNIAGTSGCNPGIGGVAKSFVAKFSDIASFTVALGKITAMTMTGTGLWKEWEPHQNSSAKFIRQGQDPNKNTFYFNSETYLEYPYSEDQVVISNDVINCCDLVVVNLLNNGNVAFQGIELNAAGTGIKKSLEPARFVPTHDSSDGNGEAKISYTIKSREANAATGNATNITETYIKSL